MMLSSILSEAFQALLNMRSCDGSPNVSVMPTALRPAPPWPRFEFSPEKSASKATPSTTFYSYLRSQSMASARKVVRSLQKVWTISLLLGYCHDSVMVCTLYSHGIR